MSLELQKYVTPYEAIQSINQIARPVGIILFGAEGTLKNRVCDEIITKVGEIANCVIYNSSDDLGERTKTAFKDRKNALIIVGNRHLNLIKRRTIINALKKLGARIVVGVCAIQVTGAVNQNSQPINDCYQANPPILDTFDELIIVRE